MNDLTAESPDSSDIDKMVNMIASELPIIRPIFEFIHLNLLLPYQHLPFWEAIKVVSAKFEAMPFREISFYREKIKNGELDRSVIEERLRRDLSSDPGETLEHFLQSTFDFTHHDLRVGRFHHQWNKMLGTNVIQLADGMLLKWVGNYLDQGIGMWDFPDAGNKGFYYSVRSLLEASLMKLPPFTKKNIAVLFRETPKEATKEHLGYLCPDWKHRYDYVSESAYTLRGWAGLIHCIENNPHLLPFRKKITLVDFIALKLILERAWIEYHDDEAKAPDFSSLKDEEVNPLLDKRIFTTFKVCQELLEEKTFRSTLVGIKLKQVEKQAGAEFQAVFCMDDRESNLRKFLEDVGPGIETFGTAGHFGIECLYQHPDDAFPKKQCPAPVPAKVLLKESLKTDFKGKRTSLSHKLIQPSHNIFEDWTQSLLGGIKSINILARNLFFPLAFKTLENVIAVTPDTILEFQNQGQGPTADGLKIGYTNEEMADLVFQQLMLIGFVKNFARMIFIIGHGSNSSNNPYFATYGCGACSGRAGSANARAFTGMANIPEVREILEKKYKLIIPTETLFIAGFHDTCRDTIEIYDTDGLTQDKKELYLEFKKILSVALYKNARERCQAFKLVTYKPIGKEAQKEVLRRSHSLFETRPEMGHTNVSYSIVGKRALTKGFKFSQPAFLQSYDRSIDPAGDILAASLGAVIPVTSGINLDYYFSSVDNVRFGAGSKLPQNIVGNIGVSHGTESDLLFGLPFQMIDQHVPLRLFVLVEHSPDIALKAIQLNKLVREIVYNNWVHYGCWDEQSESYYLFNDGQMQKIENLPGLI